MSKYVDAEWLIKESMPLSFSVQNWVNEVQIMTAPSIDIVRCKECTHWDRAIDENGIERFNFSKCVKGHYGNGFDFYCADGERRPNEI